MYKTNLQLKPPNLLVISVILLVSLLFFELNKLSSNTNSKIKNHSNNELKCKNEITDKNKTINKYVAISVNLDSDLDFYMFYLPILCMSWRSLLNFEPVCIFFYYRFHKLIPRLLLVDYVTNNFN